MVEEALKAIPLLGEIYRLPDIDQRLTEHPLWSLLIKHRSMLQKSLKSPERLNGNYEVESYPKYDVLGGLSEF